MATLASVSRHHPAVATHYQQTPPSRPSAPSGPVASSSSASAPTPTAAGTAPQAPAYPPAVLETYSPSAVELAPGPRNRLFLSLRSGIPSEVDWALPRLALASYFRPDEFKLDQWLNAVEALMEWPLRWLEMLEQAATMRSMRRRKARTDGQDELVDFEVQIPMKRQREVGGLMPEWTADPAVLRRATNSLLIFRNASYSSHNAKLINRRLVLEFVERFFDLPLDRLLEVFLNHPEPTANILFILQSIIPYIKPTALPVGLLRAMGTTVPSLLINSRDLGLICLLFPLAITSQTWPGLAPPPADLIPHLLQLITLTPPPPLLDQALDLLVALALSPYHSRTILAMSSFPAHLRHLATLLEQGATRYTARFQAPQHLQGVRVRNPASGALLAEQASQRRQEEREAAQKRMEGLGGRGMVQEVGDKPPLLSSSSKQKLYAMKEPRRSISWMHETFVYSSTSQLLQVTFWHAYRDFFQNPATSEPLLSASEVIKNVTVAFPGAQARIWMDERGENKFVIAGMGFRKGSDDDDRFTCLWRDCTRSTGLSSPFQLLQHIQQNHMPVTTPVCGWATCAHAPFTLSHLLTHMPLSRPVRVPDYVNSDPLFPPEDLRSPFITSRPPPHLPTESQMSFVGYLTPRTAKNDPTGTAFLAALLIQTLAKALRAEIATALPAEPGLSDQAKAAKKKHLQEERFGLPIPDSVLKEEEEEEADAKQGEEQENDLTADERDRAKAAFESVEQKLAECANLNLSRLGKFLGDAWGW